MIAIFYTVFSILSCALIYVGYKSILTSLRGLDDFTGLDSIPKPRAIGYKHIFLISAIAITTLIILFIESRHVINKQSFLTMSDNDLTKGEKDRPITTDAIKLNISKKIDSLKYELDKIRDFGTINAINSPLHSPNSAKDKDTSNISIHYKSSIQNPQKEPGTFSEQRVTRKKAGRDINEPILWNVHVSPFDDSTIIRSYKYLSELIEMHRNIVVSFESKDTTISNTCRVSIFFNSNIKDTKQYTSIISDINSKSYVPSKEGMFKQIESRMNLVEPIRRDREGNIINNRKLDYIYHATLDLHSKNVISSGHTIKPVGIYYISISIGDIEYFRKAYQLVPY